MLKLTIEFILDVDENFEDIQAALKADFNLTATAATWVHPTDSCIDIEGTRADLIHYFTSDYGFDLDTTYDIYPELQEVK
ncbi:MAG: hypothetical protein DRQ48_00270 [Gammaproteobacteria bacterium]|nr:MAG: hypothetical protein DRQ48_00270 [Gammaproteobacteria bacterium]